MNLVFAKLILVVAVFLDGFVGGMLPYWRRVDSDRSRFLEYGNAFAAGIFLALGLLFMLHDADGHFKQLFPEVDYPIAFALALVAFLVLMLIEHVLPSLREGKIVHAETGEGTDDFVTTGSPKFAPYMLLGALGVGSFIAGLALGAQPHIKGVLLIFLAIVAHKGSAGFALGVSMRRGGIARSWGRRLILLFALTTPTGVLVGMAATQLLTGHGEQIFIASSIALLSGVFLYVATLDILREQLAERTNHLARWSLLVTASSLMFILAIWL
ncbi:MAG: ZIP family metal transporter [Pirellulales bacterium]|nr:ZIP family metal transporter [Pirellulales bacterium]